MTAVERLLHEAHLAFQRQHLRPRAQHNTLPDGEAMPAAELRSVSFAEPQSQQWLRQHRQFRPAGYYRIHCAHDRLLWDVCASCKRDKREANANFGKMARGDRF